MTANRLHVRVSRRAVLRGTAAGAAGLGAIAIAGCGGGTKKAASTPALSPQPVSPTRVASPPPAAPAEAAWARVPFAAGPSARRDHSLTLNADDGLIYLFGGRAKGVAGNQLWAFDPKSAAWTQIQTSGAVPEARFAHNAFYDAAKKRLIIALGQGNGETFFNDVWAYASGGWARLDAASPEHPEIRYGSGGAHDVAGNRIFISHGFTDHGRFDDTWRFDLDGGAWTKIATTGPVPIKRCLTRCLWLPASGSMLLFAGQTDTNPFLGDFWTLDVTKGTWAENNPATLPGPRNLYGASLGADGRRWYIVGGNTAAGPDAETWAYDIATASWSRVEAAGEAPSARYSTDAVYAAGNLYIFGGNDGKAEIDDMWALSPAP